MNPYATLEQIIESRKPDPKTSQPPRLVREVTGFDKPTTFNLTIAENQAENYRNYRRRL
jgi:hypothetical protein